MRFHESREIAGGTPALQHNLLVFKHTLEA
jgi:hypothetical protein